jgi:uncharacterized protein YciI
MSTPAPDIRFIVVHAPGPAWQPGRAPFEQPGVAEHVGHYRAWLASGKLAMGGPFIDADGGGMMITAPGVAEDEVRAFALADPAVAAGLLTANVRRWLVGMQSA